MQDRKPILAVRVTTLMMLTCQLLAACPGSGLASEGAASADPMSVAATKLTQQLEDDHKLIRLPDPELSNEQPLARFNGVGMIAVVIDTGINRRHQDFSGKIVQEVNLTGFGAEDDATDEDGHGSHVAGIIAANGNEHLGIAPGASLIAIKVARIRDNLSISKLNKALKWVKEEAERRKTNKAGPRIAVVNLSLSIGGLHEDDEGKLSDEENETLELIKNLESFNIPVVAAAGNSYAKHYSCASYVVDSTGEIGEIRGKMGFPAILRETISVGAYYEIRINRGQKHEGFEAEAFSVRKRQIAPFSARVYLPESCRTDVFAPGGSLKRSTGHKGSTGSSYFPEGGTSQAVPYVTGAVLRIQNYWMDNLPCRSLPAVRSVERWLRDAGAKKLKDGDDEHDNVLHTLGEYSGLDVTAAFGLMQKDFKKHRCPEE